MLATPNARVRSFPRPRSDLQELQRAVEELQSSIKAHVNRHERDDPRFEPKPRREGEDGQTRAAEASGSDGDAELGEEVEDLRAKVLKWLRERVQTGRQLIEESVKQVRNHPRDEQDIVDQRLQRRWIRRVEEAIDAVRRARTVEEIRTITSDLEPTLRREVAKHLEILESDSEGPARR